MPSFGYILGFIAAALIVGRLSESGASRTIGKTASLMVLGNVVIYAIGFTWLQFALNVSWSEALALGLLPFIVGDLIKVLAAAGLLPLAWKGLDRLKLSR